MKNFRFAATVGAQILTSLGAVALGPTEVNNEYRARFLGEASSRNKKPQTSYNRFMRLTS
jgi:hypothetical protein